MDVNLGINKEKKKGGCSRNEKVLFITVSLNKVSPSLVILVNALRFL